MSRCPHCSRRVKASPHSVRRLLGALWNAVCVAELRWARHDLQRQNPADPRLTEVKQLLLQRGAT